MCIRDSDLLAKGAWSNVRKLKQLCTKSQRNEKLIRAPLFRNDVGPQWSKAIIANDTKSVK